MSAPQPLRFGICTDQNMPWDRTVALWRYYESLGFDSIWVCDHYTQPSRPGGWYFEGMTALAGLAALTTRVRVGVLVASNTFRHPALLAKEAIVIDHISHGRMEFGIGAGWFKPEHEQFGIDFQETRELVDRFREAVQVCDLLFKQERVTFAGKYYQLTDAPNVPLPVQQPRPPLTIGAKKTRMLRIAAEYADRWNASGTAEEFRGYNDILNEHCAALGRDPNSIIRSLYGWGSLMKADPWDSLEAFRDMVGTYGEAGANEFIIDHPRPDQFGVLEQVAAEYLNATLNTAGTASASFRDFWQPPS
ncbi:MAG: LLM class flavin-dependent oxidoreductase [Chloroflexi bacterium]|nr:MAG: LLM class flavin-dependent oxidoreductase [Chloroflexota bacterium]